MSATRRTIHRAVSAPFLSALAFLSFAASFLLAAPAFSASFDACLCATIEGACRGRYVVATLTTNSQETCSAYCSSWVRDDEYDQTVPAIYAKIGDTAEMVDQHLYRYPLPNGSSVDACPRVPEGSDTCAYLFPNDTYCGVEQTCMCAFKEGAKAPDGTSCKNRYMSWWQYQGSTAEQECKDTCARKLEKPVTSLVQKTDWDIAPWDSGGAPWSSHATVCPYGKSDNPGECTDFPSTFLIERDKFCTAPWNCFCRFPKDHQIISCRDRATNIGPVATGDWNGVEICKEMCAVRKLDYAEAHASATKWCDYVISGSECVLKDASEGRESCLKFGEAGTTLQKSAEALQNQGTALGSSLPLGNRSPSAVIGKIIKQLLGVVGGVALLFFVVGGIQWMTAAGSPERLGKAKANVLWSVLGLVVIFGAYAIVNFLITSLAG